MQWKKASSASVVYEGRDIASASEDVRYARAPLDCYTKTKAFQEKVFSRLDVIAAQRVVSL